MNPRYRRYLIPGLLVALLLVAAVASLAREARGAESAPGEVVSTVDDPRISESSGLALSRAEDDLAYTVNDSGNNDIVYAVRVSTGEIVGAHPVTGTAWVDTEALALSDGTLWIADVGDNRASRTDTALYAVPEPGQGDDPVTSTRYPVTLPDGPADIEALAISPSGETFLVTKALAGAVLRLGELIPGEPNVARETGTTTIGFATDAAFTPDGSRLVVRGYGSAVVLDADRIGEQTAPMATVTLPESEQGESLAVEASGTSVLVGSEGAPWDLVRVELPDASDDQAGLGVDGDDGPEPGTGTAAPAPETEGVGRPWLSILGGAAGVVILATFGVWAVRRED